MRIVVMGPSGVGKSEIGERLAAALGYGYIDGDALHSDANVQKMESGIPLDDDDRMPWLDAVGRTLRDAPALVLACSALRRSYRDRILRTAADAVFVELTASPEVLAERMRGRTHFMPPSLLASQLETWESLAPDEPGVTIVNEGDPDDVVARAVAALEDQSSR